MRRQMFVVSLLLLFFSTLTTAQCIKGDCRNGYGTYKYRSGATYKGNFHNGRMEGQGVLYFSNGDRYIGEWKDRYRTGKGKMTFVNGDLYQGNFDRNKFDGHGVMIFADGNEYDGSWKNGQMHGKGIMVYANGDKYSGEWQFNQRQGTGKMLLANGEIQEGNWIEDMYQYEAVNTIIADASPSTTNDKSSLIDCNTTYCNNKKGYYHYSDGSKYIGDFVNGKPEGQGKCYYKNGDVYIGQWKNNAPHGEGVYTYKNKKTIAAIWSYGRPLRRLETFTQGDLAGINVDKDDQVKIWAVVVGISTYEHMPALRFTDDDAYRFYAFLKSPEGGALSNEQIKILIDENATRTNILNTLKETLLQADENDVIVFYYSGHGLEGSFIPVDYDGFNNRLMHDEIKLVFEQSKAKHKMIFADACYSGSLFAMQDASNLLTMKAPVHQMMKKYYQSFENTKGGLAFFTSSQSEEISLEDGGLRQGVFTHFLIRGLNGEADTNYNKIVTIKEIQDFVTKGVRKYTAKVQTPVITGNYDSNMPVAVMR